MREYLEATPPHERLAFELRENEFELREILAEPLSKVVLALEEF